MLIKLNIYKIKFQVFLFKYSSFPISFVLHYCWIIIIFFSHLNFFFLIYSVNLHINQNTFFNNKYFSVISISMIRFKNLIHPVFFFILGLLICINFNYTKKLCDIHFYFVYSQKKKKNLLELNSSFSDLGNNICFDIRKTTKTLTFLMNLTALVRFY